MEKLFEYIYSDQGDRKWAFSEIMLLGKNMIDSIIGDDEVVIPMSPRAYYAAVYNYFPLIPGLTKDDEMEYKKDILDECWGSKFKRSDEMFDYGIGEREVFAIGVSAQTADRYCNLDNMIMERRDDYLSGESVCNDDYPIAPVLRIVYSDRADQIEKMLEKNEIQLSDLYCVDLFDTGIVFDGKQIKNAKSLIECVKTKRKCGISEAVVETALIYVETYLQGVV